ncbi:unnamed protein product [Meganyctiphanes norvegica]|uniref:Fibrinogen C-terminal domain-containing protein n=1 Tax=Meganyctiphanes norvegica TaxID=48144 RepID=A0AAV2SH79_MEGNR
MGTLCYTILISLLYLKLISCKESPARNCFELLEQGMDSDGINIIFPYSNHPDTSVMVFCDQTTEHDGRTGGWTVIQRRTDGNTDFYRGWEEYEIGFGTVDDEFWVGNIVIHEITEQTVNEILIELEDWDGEIRHAHYKDFHVADNTVVESKHHNYQLDISLYTGDAGDSLSYHDGEDFSTFDSDNDDATGNCAETRHGGWWYGNCAHSNLNGRYYSEGDAAADSDGVQWETFHGASYSHKKTSMKIRPYQG